MYGHTVKLDQFTLLSVRDEAGTRDCRGGYCGAADILDFGA